MTQVAFTLVTIHDYQSVIQLAAGINLGVSVFQSLRLPSESMFRQAVQDLQQSLKKYALAILDDSERKVGRGEIIGEERRSKLNKFVINTQMASFVARDAEADLSRRLSQWQRIDEWYMWWPTALVIVSIALLFYASGQSPTINIDDDKIDMFRELSYWNSLQLSSGLSILFTPLFASVANGLWARWIIHRHCQDMKQALKKVQNSLIED